MYTVYFLIKYIQHDMEIYDCILIDRIFTTKTSNLPLCLLLG